VVPYLAADVRRASIIDAAVAVIAREGLAKATTRRIAEEANAPLGTLHYCFRNKDELILLVLERGTVTMTDAFAKIDPAKGLEATIRNNINAYWRWLSGNLGLHLALMELLMWLIRNKPLAPPGQPDLHTIANERFGGKIIRDSIAEAAKLEGVTPRTSPDDLARFMIHRFDGMVFEYAETNDERSCKRQTKLLAEALVALAVP
jgi:AcrR family transcriptional regulator